MVFRTTFDCKFLPQKAPALKGVIQVRLIFQTQKYVIFAVNKDCTKILFDKLWSFLESKYWKI